MFFFKKTKSAVPTPTESTGVKRRASGGSARSMPGASSGGDGKGRARKSTKQTITHSRLGEVVVLRSARARRISLSVKPDGTIRLSVPRTVSMENGMRFLDEKASWAEQTRARLATRYPKSIIEPPFSTRRHILKLFPGDVLKISVRLSDGEIRVRYPAAVSHVSEEVQAAIKKGIEEAWRAEAQEYLPGRVRELSRLTGMACGHVSIRNTVSKWGSCSVRNDISLSLHLMRLPDHLIDYIILHELCHTAHHNHGPAFHALLDRVSGGRHAAFRREIRKYHTRW